MGHKKGVSHKSDRRLLAVLLEAGGRLSWSEVVRRSGLDERTVTKRLEIHRKSGMVRRTVEPKHGHFVSYDIPWSEREAAYVSTYGRHSEIYNQIEAGLLRLFSRMGQVTVTPRAGGKVRILIRLRAQSTAQLMRELEPLVNAHPWMNERPFSEVVVNGRLWLGGLLCRDCLDISERFPKPLMPDAPAYDYGNPMTHGRSRPFDVHYFCPQCGREYAELVSPISEN